MPENQKLLKNLIADDIIKSHLIPSENFIYGYADLTGLLDEKFEGYDYGISIGRILNKQVVDKIIEGPTLEYYEHYRDVNKELAMIAEGISKDLKSNKIDVITIEPTVTTDELDTIYFSSLRTDLSHKMVATRAGLGWIGKTDLFVSKKFGPRLRLVSLLLRTMVKGKSKPFDFSLCGTCNTCVDICPAKAANGILWDIKVKREIFFNAWKCRDQCAEFGSKKLGFNARICGMCVAACPVGQK